MEKNEKSRCWRAKQVKSAMRMQFIESSSVWGGGIRRGYLWESGMREHDQDELGSFITKIQEIKLEMAARS